MKLGCNTVMFNQLDLYGALQHIAWAGYVGAEIVLSGGLGSAYRIEYHAIIH